MASTYSNLGIELIGTGEQAGSWGTTTNGNLQNIIDNAIVGYVKVTLTTAGTSGSPNTLNVAPGAASDGQKRVIEVYSATDLGAICFLQITPATFAGYYIIRNSLAGSRSLRIFQGSYVLGNSVLLSPGYDAIIRCDGAATPKVTNILSNIPANISGNANTATIATSVGVTYDASTPSSFYPVWVTSPIAGAYALNASPFFSFVPSTGVLTATSFAGAGTGLTGTATSLTAGTATNATNATNTAITNDVSTGVSVYPTWVTANTGNLPQKTSSASFSFVPSTGVLSVTGLVASGNIGLGASPVTGSNYYNSKNISGATTAYANNTIATVQSGVSSNGIGYNSTLTVAAGATVGNLVAYFASNTTYGASSYVQNAYGYQATNITGGVGNYYFAAGDASTTSNTSYAFYSAANINSFGGTSWAFYAAGTANNYFGGKVGIGRTPTTNLDVNGSFALSAPSLTNASTYTVATTDVSLRFTTTACTVTLPAASSFTGRILYLNNVTAIAVTSGSANVKPLGSDTAGTAILAATAGKFAMIQSDGSYWITMMAN